jgi:acetyl esterase
LPRAPGPSLKMLLLPVSVLQFPARFALLLAFLLVGHPGALARGATPDVTQVYRQDAGRSYALDIYYPAQPRAGTQAPALLFFHGGGWAAGNKGQFAAQAAELTRTANLVVVSAEYPLNRDPVEASRAAQAAACWLRQRAGQLGIDPARIALAGASSGGQIAAAAVLQREDTTPECASSPGRKAEALVLFNPVLDLQSWNRRFGLDLRAVSPIDLVDQRLPPTLILQGTADRVAPVRGARRFVEAAERAGGGPVKLVEYADRQHGFFNKQANGDLQRTLEEVVQFLRGLGWAV